MTRMVDHEPWVGARRDSVRALRQTRAHDLTAALRYGDVRANLAKLGQPIGPLDTQIAAHAPSLGVTLVTSNEREFRRVTGLRVENWT